MFKWLVLAILGFLVYSMFDSIGTERESRNLPDSKATTPKTKKDAEPPTTPMGDWRTGFYVDEFGDSTDQGFVALTSSGSFSNSATTGSPLTVKMFINSGTRDPWFRLYEYAGNNPVKGTYSDSRLNSLKCRVKQLENEPYTIEFTQFQGADSFQLAGDGRNKLRTEIILRAAIESEANMKVSCYLIDRPTTKYKFALDFNHFENAITKVEKKPTS